MLKKEFGISLNAPAFLGDAEQKGVWRTPPIKAMVREWWRVAAAPAEEFCHQRLRPIEGKLFGNAWLDNDFSKSRVRMALEHWQFGKMTQYEPLQKVDHPEAEKANNKVEPLNYLGYGPIDRGQFKNGAALQANETNTLSLACPDGDAGKIEQALQLIDWFGAFGGRSRNGWGSLGLSGQCALTRRHPSLTGVLRPLADCLKLDWPHAIGRDDQGPLIWESSASFNDWQAAMRFLAQTKIGFRTNLGFTTGNGSSRIEGRHIVAYPVTNHDVRAWGGQARLANQLRFKLYRDASRQLRTRIYHTPHACPLPVPSALQQIAVWQTVHRWLDEQSTLTRLGA